MDKQKYYVLTWEECKHVYDKHCDEIFPIADGELFAVPCNLIDNKNLNKDGKNSNT